MCSVTIGTVRVIDVSGTDLEGMDGWMDGGGGRGSTEKCEERKGCEKTEACERHPGMNAHGGRRSRIDMCNEA